jgi:hypothetical protein
MKTVVWQRTNSSKQVLQQQEDSGVAKNVLELGGFKRPFPPPSPAKHIRALLARRHGSVKLIEASILKNGEPKLGHRGCSPGRHMHLRQWPSHGCGGQHALVQGCE